MIGLEACVSKPPSSDASRSWRRIETVVALSLAVPLAELRASTRRRADVAFARQVAMYVAHTVAGMGHSAIGRLSRRDRKTVAHACRLVEQRRDNPAVDRILRALEDHLGSIPTEVPCRQRSVS